jgi:threonine/homoserine/homoserine lactone efflux protein
MASLDVLLAFALATAVFAFVPGPAILYTAAQTIVRGRRAGFMAAFGLHIGCYAHVFAAGLGLSVLFKHVPEAFLAVKIVGALYLVWLGVGMIRTKDIGADLPVVPQRSAARAFGQSMMVEVLNPKTAIFFLAFLPQFVDPAGAVPVGIQFLILGAIVNLMFSMVDVLTVLFTSVFVSGLRRSIKAQRVMRWTGGSIMIGLGLRLAVDKGPAG